MSYLYRLLQVCLQILCRIYYNALESIVGLSIFSSAFTSAVKLEHMFHFCWVEKLYIKIRHLKLRLLESHTYTSIQDCFWIGVIYVNEC